MKTKVLKYINDNNMLHDTEVIVMGVSGGPDSVCLLFLLSEILKDTDIVLEVVHVNHLIRNEASLDAAFVEELCKSRNIKFHIVEADVKEFAKINKLSTEEAGRKIRYDAFRKVLGRRKGKIAIAHNANDRAETMLFNLIRGTGIKGLTGISPVNDILIRPILCLSRDEVMEYINSNNLEYVIDQTNLTDDYTRNKIRHNILDYAVKEISPLTVESMNKAADQLAQIDYFLSKYTIEAAMRCIKKEKNGESEIITYDVKKLLMEDNCIINRIFYESVGMLAGTKKDITWDHINLIFGILGKSGTKSIDLPYGITVIKEYDDISFIRGNINTTESVLPSIKTRIIEEFDINDVPRENYTKWFDYDKISNIYELRYRKEGDFISINKELKKQSLKDYFINEKIPKEERDRIPVLADGSHIIWVIGHRISEYYKVTKDTKKVLEVSL